MPLFFKNNCEYECDYESYTTPYCTCMNCSKSACMHNFDNITILVSLFTRIVVNLLPVYLSLVLSFFLSFCRSPFPVSAPQAGPPCWACLRRPPTWNVGPSLCSQHVARRPRGVLGIVWIKVTSMLSACWISA